MINNAQFSIVVLQKHFDQFQGHPRSNSIGVFVKVLEIIEII